MDRTDCRWVCEWLPLFVEDRDGLPGDPDDLSSGDRARIEQHLLGCAACRSRRSALTEVLSVLSLAAEEAPAGPAADSILPAVQERIRWQQEHSRTAWSRTWRALGITGIPGVAAPPLRTFCRLRAAWPLRAGWIRDSLRERAGQAAAGLRASLRDIPIPLRDLRVVAAMAAMVFGAFLLAGTAHNRQAEAEARITANAVPIPGMDVPRGALRPEPEAQAPAPLVVAEEEKAAEAHGDSPAVVTEPAAAPLALAAAGTGVLPSASSRTAGTPNPAVAAGVSAPSSAVAAAAAAAPRYDFDLEHGTPMPPETRGGKPAY